MKNDSFNRKYLFDARFEKVEPRKADEIRDNYPLLSTHNHSKFRADLENEDKQLEERIEFAGRHNISFVLTDHEVRGIDRNNRSITDQRFEQILELYEAEINNDRTIINIKDPAITVIKGKEFHAKDGSHILGIGYIGEIENNHNLSTDKLVEVIKEAEGIAVYAHPGNIIMGGVAWKKLVKSVKSGSIPHAIEGFTIHSLGPMNYFNVKSIKLGRKYKLPMLPSADTHSNEHMLRAHNYIPKERFEKVKGNNGIQELKAIIKERDYYNYAEPLPAKDFVKGFWNRGLFARKIVKFAKKKI